MASQEWDQRYAGNDLVWTAEPNRFVVAELQDLAPARALDVAAGEGRNTVSLAGRGWQVTAVDFSAVGLDKGRRLAEQADVTVGLGIAPTCASTSPRPGFFQLVLIAYLHLGAAELDGVSPPGSRLRLRPGRDAGDRARRREPDRGDRRSAGPGRALYTPKRSRALWTASLWRALSGSGGLSRAARAMRVPILWFARSGRGFLPPAFLRLARACRGVTRQ